MPNCCKVMPLIVGPNETITAERVGAQSKIPRPHWRDAFRHAQALSTLRVNLLQEIASATHRGYEDHRQLEIGTRSRGVACQNP